MPKAAARKRSGTYVIDISLRGEDGKLHRYQRSGFATLKERDREIKRLRAEEAEGTDVFSAERLTVAELGEMWARDREAVRITPGTVKAYRQGFRMWINPAIGSLKLAELSNSLPVDELREKMLAGGLAPATATQYLHYLRWALTWAMKKRLVSRNVAKESSLPVKGPKPEFELPTDAQIAAAIGRIAVTPKGCPWSYIDRSHHQVLLVLLANTGLRISEALNLRWEDVDFDRLQIVVRKSKTDAGRRKLSIREEVAVQLRRLLPRRLVGGGFVFVRGDGARVLDVSFRHVLANLGDELGFHLHPHLLRHYHASACLASGMEWFKLSRRLGHKSIVTTTDIYGHMRPEFDREGALAATDALWLAMEAV